MYPPNSALNRIAPAEVFEEIDVSVSDADLRNEQIKGLYVGGGGDLVITDRNDNEVTFYSVSGFLPIAPKTVKAASTATNIIALLID